MNSSSSSIFVFLLRFYGEDFHSYSQWRTHNLCLAGVQAPWIYILVIKNETRNHMLLLAMSDEIVCM